MVKKRRWLWVFLFISVALLLGVLATGWNVVLVLDYQYILTLAKKVPSEIRIPEASLIVRMILGTLGFVAVLALTILLFIKLLNEMRLNQQQSEFLAAMSHELKTPLAAIELSSTLIQAGGLEETEIQRLWKSHRTELKRLREELEALLDAAQWQAKPPLQKKSSILFESWIQDSFDRWKQILGPDAILDRTGEPLPFDVFLDLKTLNVIMDNLFSNSRKFSKGTPQVKIRTQRLPPKSFFAKARWKIQIEDQGWGFDPADSKKIFHRFFRSHTQAPYAIPGTGLGLYLANSASRAMGLSLKGESLGMGQGAIFTLEGPEIL